MSTSDPRVEEPAERPVERDQPPRLGWKPALLLGGGVGLVAVLASAWFVITSLQLGQVEVAWTTPVECRGTELIEAQTGINEDPVEAVRLVPGMKCRIGVQVSNQGTSAVHVTEVVLPYMGPGGGAAVRVVELDGLEPGPDPQDVDAVFAVEREVAPGEDYEFQMTFVFRPRGCTAQGLMTVDGMPTVTVSSWGREVEQTSEEMLAFRGTKESSCDS